MQYEEVRVRDCACPDAPHEDGDIVYLNPKLSVSGGIAAEQIITEFVTAHAPRKKGAVVTLPTNDDLTRRLLTAFTRHETVGWNLVDDKGKPVPFDPEVIAGDWSLARAVAGRAGELYIETAMAPFQSKPAERSPTGQTPATTSPRRTPTRKPSAQP